MGEGGVRAAIYARMSTDKQSDTSPKDQIARRREYAERQGWRVVEAAVVAEHGISGASRHNRPGLSGLIERVAEFDVLVAYDFPRLARNQEDLGWIRNRLRIRQRQAIDLSTSSQGVLREQDGTLSPLARKALSVGAVHSPWGVHLTSS